MVARATIWVHPGQVVRDDTCSSPIGPSAVAVGEDAAQRLRGAVQQFVRAFGLLSSDQTPCGEPVAPSHAHALMLLLEAGRADQRVSQQALASALGIDKSNVTRLCTKLERLGHIDQARPAEDGRVRQVGLTAQGRRVAERIEAASRARFRDVLEALPSAAEREDAIAAVQRLNDAIELVARKRQHA